jgi:hypothetical protein
MAKLSDLKFTIPQEQFNPISIISLIILKKKKYNHGLYYFEKKYNNDYRLEFQEDYSYSETTYFTHNNYDYHIKADNYINENYLKYVRTIDKSISKPYNKFTRLIDINTCYLTMVSKFRMGFDLSEEDTNKKLKKLQLQELYHDDILNDEFAKTLLFIIAHSNGTTDVTVTNNFAEKVMSLSKYKFDLNEYVSIDHINEFINQVNNWYQTIDRDICFKYSNYEFSIGQTFQIKLCNKLIFETDNINKYRYLFNPALYFIIKIINKLNHLPSIDTAFQKEIIKRFL